MMRIASEFGFTPASRSRILFILRMNCHCSMERQIGEVGKPMTNRWLRIAWKSVVAALIRCARARLRLGSDCKACLSEPLYLRALRVGQCPMGLSGTLVR